MIKKKVFPATGNLALSESRAEDAMNDWLKDNPSCRVINIETIQAASGGGGFLDSTNVSLEFNGLRVWYETEGQEAL